jgi:diketogulonate reductase-like aldo/keto reductase
MSRTEAISVEHYTLSDGGTVPWLAWGAGNSFGAQVLKAGIRHIDTAQGYGTEGATGKVVKESGLDKSTVYVTSKLSQVNGKAVPVSQVRPLVEESLKKLGFVPDLFLIHNPFVAESTEELKKIWGVLEDLKDEGKLKSLGVSNFRPQDLEAIASIAKHSPVVNQFEFHPYVLTHLQPVLAIQAKSGITTAAYGPLTPVLRHPTGGPLKPVLERIADRLSSSSAASSLSGPIDSTTVLLLWLREHGVIAVTGTQNSERIKTLAHLVNAKEDTLTKDEVEEIDRVGKTVHFRHYKEHMTKDFPEPDLPDGTDV